MLSIPHVEARLRCFAHKFAVPHKLKSASQVCKGMLAWHVRHAEPSDYAATAQVHQGVFVMPTSLLMPDPSLANTLLFNGCNCAQAQL